MRGTRTLAALTVTALLAVAATACDDGDEDAAATTGSAPASFSVTLAPQNDSGLSGTAEFVEAGSGRTRVTIALDGEDTGPARPAHVHEGTCANLDPTPAYGLNSVEGGSGTVILASLDELRSEPYAVNLHQSAGNIETYVACGDLP
jgi:hypothetical protein